MKTTIIVILLLALAYIFVEFELSPKQSSFTLRYIQPLMEERISPGIDEFVAGVESEILDSDDAAMRDPAPVRVELRRVIDGDTIDVYINGEVERVRYIGVNTPEFGEPCYQEASLANRRLVENQTLTLERDVSDRDDFGRLLRYVFANGVQVNRQLVGLGFAEAVRYNPDDNYYQEFRELEQNAAEQGLGCHPSGIFDDGSLVR